jgi:hypothetical protein
MKIVFLSLVPPVPELTVLQRLGANCTGVNSAKKKIPYFFSHISLHTLNWGCTFSVRTYLTLCLLIRPNRRNTALTLTAGIFIKDYNIKQKLYLIPDMRFSGTDFPEESSPKILVTTNNRLQSVTTQMVSS